VGERERESERERARQVRVRVCPCRKVWGVRRAQAQTRTVRKRSLHANARAIATSLTRQTPSIMIKHKAPIPFSARAKEDQRRIRRAQRCLGGAVGLEALRTMRADRLRPLGVELGAVALLVRDLIRSELDVVRADTRD